MSWGLRGVKPEHNGAKNGGGYWGLRHDAKIISRLARRNEDELEIEKGIGDTDELSGFAEQTDPWAGGERRLPGAYPKVEARKPRPAKLGRRALRTRLRKDVAAAAAATPRPDSTEGPTPMSVAEEPLTKRSRWERFKCWLYRGHLHERTYKVIGFEERWGIITPECVHCGYDELPAPWGGGPKGYA